MTVLGRDVKVRDSQTWQDSRVTKCTFKLDAWIPAQTSKYRTSVGGAQASGLWERPRGNTQRARVKTYKMRPQILTAFRDHGLTAKECHSPDTLLCQIYKDIKEQWDQTIFQVNIGRDVPKFLSGMLCPALASLFTLVTQHLQVELLCLQLSHAS